MYTRDDEQFDADVRFLVTANREVARDGKGRALPVALHHEQRTI